MTTLSDIFAFRPAPVIEHAGHWADHGESWIGGYSGVMATASGLMSSFTGDTADATFVKVSGDQARVLSELSPAVFTAVNAAINATGILASKQANLLAYTQAITAQGYDVADDGEVTDPTGNVARARQAQAYTTDVQDLIRQFTQASEEGAAAVRAGRQTLAESRFADGTPIPLDTPLGVDPNTGDPIPQPPAGPVPPGKQWWYHYGSGWQLQDHLHDCPPGEIRSDIIGVLGTLLTPFGGAGVLADLNAVNAITDINQCEGP